MKRTRRAIDILTVALAVAGSSIPLARAGDAVVAGEVRADATFEHLGVVWTISGDDDLDSSMALEFRPQGGGAWSPGAPAMRAHPTLIVNGTPLGLNSWGASALFLVPGQAYELRLTLTDAAGGAETHTVVASTAPASMPASEFCPNDSESFAS